MLFLLPSALLSSFPRRVPPDFDNGGANKVPSATLVMERTKPWVDQGYPVIFTGDFNSQLNSDSYAILVNGLGNGFKLTNTYDIVANPRFARNNGDTFNDNFGCPRYVSLGG